MTENNDLRKEILYKHMRHEDGCAVHRNMRLLCNCVAKTHVDQILSAFKARLPKKKSMVNAEIYNPEIVAFEKGYNKGIDEVEEGLK